MPLSKCSSVSCILAFDMTIFIKKNSCSQWQILPDTDDKTHDRLTTFWWVKWHSFPKNVCGATENILMGHKFRPLATNVVKFDILSIYLKIGCQRHQLFNVNLGRRREMWKQTITRHFQYYSGNRIQWRFKLTQTAITVQQAGTSTHIINISLPNQMQVSWGNSPSVTYLWACKF